MSSESSDSSTWASANDGYDDWAMIQAHVTDYSRRTKKGIEKLNKIWTDIGISKAEQREHLVHVDESINRVWSQAVEMAEAQRRDLQVKVDEAVEEIYKIKEDLGDGWKQGQQMGIEGLLRLDNLVGSTLKSRYESVQNLLAEWKAKRDKRFLEYKRMLGLITKSKLRLGDAVIGTANSPRMADISLSNLSKLEGELEDYKREIGKRERELEALLSKLRRVCIELNENDVEIASQAHPSLRYYREALSSNHQYTLVRPSFLNQTEIKTDLRPEDKELDLSLLTFMALEQKIEEVYNLRREREEKCKEVSSILHNLWNVLKIEEDDFDRGIHLRLLEGPTCLHAKSIDKCIEEVERLEQAYAKLLWEMIDKKTQELRIACEETMLPMPDLSSLYQSDYGERCSVGQISDALSKISKMVQETRTLGEKRVAIIKLIEELEKSNKEVSWLFDYETDEDRYKGRDFNKKLQRAIRAGRVRDRMPSLISKIKGEIRKWEEAEQCPFVYDSQDYMVILDNLDMNFRNSMAAKALNAKTANSGVTSNERPLSRSRSRAAATPPPNKNSSTNGTRTPTERHSNIKRHTMSFGSRAEAENMTQNSHVSSMTNVPDGLPSGRRDKNGHMINYTIPPQSSRPTSKSENNFVSGGYAEGSRLPPPPSVSSVSSEGWRRINDYRPESAFSAFPTVLRERNSQEDLLLMLPSQSDNGRSGGFLKRPSRYQKKVLDEDYFCAPDTPSIPIIESGRRSDCESNSGQSSRGSSAFSRSSMKSPLDRYCPS